MRFFFVIILFFIVNLSFGQDFILNERYIQLTGLVLNSDSQQPVPNASIRIRNTYRGVSANMQGFYSIVAKEGDWIDVTCMGYKSKSIQVPEGLKEPSYIKIFVLESDTIVFKTVNIYPWPSKAKFKEAFMTVQINKSYQQIMDENFNRITMQLMMATLLPDAIESQSNAMKEYSNQSANRGMVPTLGVGANIPFGSTKGYSSKKSDKPAIKW